MIAHAFMYVAKRVRVLTGCTYPPIYHGSKICGREVGTQRNMYLYMAVHHACGQEVTSHDTREYLFTP